MRDGKLGTSKNQSYGHARHSKTALLNDCFIDQIWATVGQETRRQRSVYNILIEQGPPRLQKLAFTHTVEELDVVEWTVVGVRVPV